MKKYRTFLKLNLTAISLNLMVSLMMGLYNDAISKHSINETSIDPAIVLDATNLPDKDKDGIDDFTDIMLGAREDALNMVTYYDSYYSGGYPPDNIGVCSDVIWRALKAAGYNFKDLIDADIAANPEAYPNSEIPDPNIDFRRTRNLKAYFERHLVKLTNNIYEIDQWLPGDIVVFYPDTHIGIISDQKNFMGIPYLIHNTGQLDREEDIMMYAAFNSKISGHYRWINAK
ncbi:MAG: hypothetical protein FD133_1376 [Erysipelotrichaceae bacterium]|nr:MAG: hypothetical protein FD179_13 [Erysipelotrichaceae bacterium]TXT17451.1 MAG: hypothetical protein FD133_1376 [Erysipelotrichaceae bacterium]